MIIDEQIKETPAKLLKGTSATPAANHFFTVNPDCNKISEVDVALYHHLMANSFICQSKRNLTCYWQSPS
jgi:hypothetical protein